MNKKRKICIVVNSRANYARIKSLLIEIQNHEKLELQLVVGASALLYRYGSSINHILKDGFKPAATLHSIIEGESPSTMAKSTGIATLELATHFENLKPDLVLTVADRFETLATAISASYMNIPLVHTQGGETTGSIDESVRHAITKLAHVHFPSTKKAKENIIKMGEDPKFVFLTGCPSIDLIKNLNLEISKDFFDAYLGVGPKIFTDLPYIVVLQHPVTTEYGSGYNQIQETLKSIKKLALQNLQVVWLWPNIDAGTDEISKGIREFRETNSNLKIHFFRNFTPEDYLKLINSSLCIVGNSSSGIREGSFLGVPCVNIGNRQNTREKSNNVIDVDYNDDKILAAVQYQIQHGKYKCSNMYGDGMAGKKMAEILATVSPEIQKSLKY